MRKIILNYISFVKYIISNIFFFFKKEHIAILVIIEHSKGQRANGPGHQGNLSLDIVMWHFLPVSLEEKDKAGWFVIHIYSQG